MKALIYVIIIVAVLTYFTMFNINSLAQGFDQLYSIKKKRVVQAMKKDNSESWKVLGQRFEVFRPKHENPEPSEWLIPLYTILHPGALFGFGGSSGATPNTTALFDKEVASPWAGEDTRENGFKGGSYRLKNQRNRTNLGLSSESTYNL